MLPRSMCRCVRATPGTGGRRGTGPGARGAAGGGPRGVATRFIYTSTIYLIIYTSTACVSIYTMSPGLGAGAGRAAGRGGGTPRPPPPWQPGSRGRPTPGTVQYSTVQYRQQRQTASRWPTLAMHSTQSGFCDLYIYISLMLCRLI